MKGRISVTRTNDANRRDKKLTFKNNATFGSCTSKINNNLVDNAEDPDIAMPMCNNNYFMTWHQEVCDTGDTDNNDNMID